MRLAPPARLALLAALAAAAACSASGRGAVIDRATTVDDGGNMIARTVTTDVVVDSLTLAPAAALSAVSDAYVALGMTPNTLDPARRVAGVRNVMLSRRLQGVPLTTYFDCGADLGVPIASNNRVEVTMLTEVRPAGAGATMHTSLQARAHRTASGAQLDPIDCVSRGTLERKLAQTAQGR